MTQATQTRLKFKGDNGDGGSVVTYIDLAAALSAVDRKQYHHVSAYGTALAYHFTITPAKLDVTIDWCVMSNSWTTANAVKMASNGWKAQLKHAGIRHSELPPYGKRARFALEQGSFSTGTGTLLSHYIPVGCGDKPMFTSFDAPAGTVTYGAANEVTRVPVTDAAGDLADELSMCLVGDSDVGSPKAFGVIAEYLKGRRNMGSQPTLPGEEFPDKDGLMLQLYSVSEELSDDIIDTVDDYGIFRPYDEVSAAKLLAGGAVSSNSSERMPISMDGVAPCGLIKINGAIADDTFYVDVHAIVEMS